MTIEADIAISDDELTALALAADPEAPIADDAVPFGCSVDIGVALLPAWYMPAPGPGGSRTRRLVFAIVVVALITLNVLGMCVTYGFPDPVW